jgi:amidase
LAAELEALNGWVMRQPDVWWNGADHAPTPELVSEAAMDNLVAEEPVPDEVA